MGKGVLGREQEREEQEQGARNTAFVLWKGIRTAGSGSAHPPLTFEYNQAGSSLPPAAAGATEAAEPEPKPVLLSQVVCPLSHVKRIVGFFFFLKT